MRTNILPLSILTALLVACGQKTPPPPAASGSSGDPDTLAVTADQMKSVTVEKVAPQSVLITEETVGKVNFNEDAATPIYSPYTGRITELLAKPGDFIRKGAPILIVDSPEVVDAENDFLSGRAAVAKAQAILKQAERTRDRLQRLVAGEAAAPKDLEQALTDVESARNDLRSAEAQVDTARQRILNFGKTPAEVDQLAISRIPDRTTRVYAPISGIIVARKVGPGQYVRPDNPDPLFTVADTSTMWLLAQVYESQVPAIRVGQAVEVKVLALPDQTFSARVVYIAPTVDPTSRRVAVRVVLQNRNNQLRPEMFASFRFQQTTRQALMVPRKAIVQEGNLNVAWVLLPGNRVTRRIVQVGVEREGLIEIKSGLAEGDQVIGDGALFLSSFRKA